MGCNKILNYADIPKHDKECEFQPVKCLAFDKCGTKCIRRDIT